MRCGAEGLQHITGGHDGACIGGEEEPRVVVEQVDDLDVAAVREPPEDGELTFARFGKPV